MTLKSYLLKYLKTKFLNEIDFIRITKSIKTKPFDTTTITLIILCYF